MTVNAKSEEDRQRKAMFKKEEGAKDEDAKTGDAEVQVNESDGEHVHEGILCNGCEIQPIVGTRYKCLECDFLGAISIFIH